MDGKAKPSGPNVLETAFRHFNLHGYEGASLDAVAKELRMSKKTIYKLFSNKEEILKTAVSHKLDELWAHFGKEDSLESTVSSALLFFTTFSEKLVHGIRESAPEIWRSLSDFEVRIRTSLELQLGHAADKKQTRFHESPAEFASVLMGWLRVSAHSAGSKAHAGILLKGILKKGKKKKKK